MSDEQPITKLHVSTSSDEEERLRAQGFSLINVDLNAGVRFKEGAKSVQVLLWYKKECGEKPVTRIQVSFSPAMKTGLLASGFEQISRDLNTGTPGDHIFLWYLCGSSAEDVPIVDLKVTVDEVEEPDLLKNGYERLGCDLNRKAGGNWIYLWVKRKEATYIYDITATDCNSHDKSLFEQGYTRVDEDTNRGTTGSPTFLWYRRSRDKSRALSDLDVSTSFQEAFNLQQKSFKQVSKNLNKGTGGSDIFVWSLKDGCKKVQGVNLLVNPNAGSEYEKGGIEVIDKNLNEGSKGGQPIHIAYYAA